MLFTFHFGINYIYKHYFILLSIIMTLKIINILNNIKKK